VIDVVGRKPINYQVRTYLKEKEFHDYAATFIFYIMRLTSNAEVSRGVPLFPFSR